MANLTILTPEKRAEFLEKLTEYGKVSKAAQLIGVSRQALYQLKNKDAQFAKEWEEAAKIGREILVDEMEEEAHRRAVEGVDKDVYYKGTVCGSVKEYSDTTLIFLLKGYRPERYSERLRTELTGKDGAAIQIQNLSDEERAARINSILERARQRRDSSNSEPSS